MQVGYYVRIDYDTPELNEAAATQEIFDGQGRWTDFAQDGWRISILDYLENQQPHLPRKLFLARDTLQRIQLGGWGPDAAKASAYEKRESAVLMYDFACKGARRTFLGLFLHELGHAHEVDLDEPTKDVLHAQYRVLVDNNAFFGIEFLVDPDTRKLYQKFVFEEFLAETYMIYVACGGGMREEIARYEGPVRDAWERVYEVFRDTFHGIEYE